MRAKATPVSLLELGAGEVSGQAQHQVCIERLHAPILPQSVQQLLVHMLPLCPQHVQILHHVVSAGATANLVCNGAHS